MSFYMFNDRKEKVDVKLLEGTISAVPANSSASKTITIGAIGETFDSRNYAVIGLMSGYGTEVGGTNRQGNPTTASDVANGKVYPNVEFDMNTDYETIKVNVYNSKASTETLWYRILLMKVSDEF